MSRATRPNCGMVAVAAAGLLASAQAQTTDSQLIAQQAVLNIVWETLPVADDRLSTNDMAEARRLHPIGPMYYVASRAGSASLPLLRMRAPEGDHRADTQLAAGYVQEGTLGYLWPASRHPPGTTPVWLATNPRTGDHGLALPNAAPKGYQAAPLADGYAWPRPDRATDLLVLQGRQVGISSNLAAGGALWSLSWHGQQFIDQTDYGRLVQSSLSFSGPGASRALPTEGGDQTADADPRIMHGAPVLAATNTRSSQGSIQHTRAIPLEWRHTDFNGGQPARPVAYPGWQLGKDITLDDSRLPLGADHPEWAGQVMRYLTAFVNGGPPLPRADIEIPTAYLKPVFRRAYTCDATQADPAHGLHEVMGAEYEQLDAQTWHYQFNTQAGGVILANDALSHALGIYGSQPDQGGSARYFTLWKFGTATTPVVTKASAGAGPLTLASGTNRFRSWLVVGQAREVCAIMQRMYARGLR